MSVHELTRPVYTCKDLEGAQHLEALGGCHHCTMERPARSLQVYHSCEAAATTMLSLSLDRVTNPMPFLLKTFT